MLKCLFVLFAITISCTLPAQDCDCFLNYYKAESLYFNQKDKHLSVQYFRKAFEDPKFGSLADVYNAFDKVFRLDSFEYAKTLLEKSIIKGGSVEGIEKYSKYYPNLIYDKERLKNISDSVINIRKPSDSLLIRDLEYMESRDQFIRENEGLEGNSILNMRYIDRMNYLWLKEIILRNDGKLPTYEQIGIDGFDFIKTILHHFDLDYIIDLWPYFIRSIQEDRAPINDILVYQLDRTMVLGEDIVYLENGKLFKKKKNNRIPNSKFYYQNLGGMSTFIQKEKLNYWWPFNPELNKENANKIRKALCLDSLDVLLTRLSYYKYFTDSDDFIQKVD